jgi:hypothetical protein
VRAHYARYSVVFCHASACGLTVIQFSKFSFSTATPGVKAFMLSLRFCDFGFLDFKFRFSRFNMA